MLLFPDPRPLVERLGQGFFKLAPEYPGVYLMRDAADAVLYVGKARNLRKRLRSYRVANPDRMPHRHLRLVRAVHRIDFERCVDEQAALARESALLRTLRPKFNRAGTWPGVPKYIGWRVTQDVLELGLSPALDANWNTYGPLRSGAWGVYAVLVRLLWCALRAERGLAGMPEGWFEGRFGNVSIGESTDPPERLQAAALQLKNLFAGRAEHFVEWIRQSAVADSHSFATAVREADLEALLKWASKGTAQVTSVPLEPAAFTSNEAPIRLAR
jgi:predicted GIY-YIG superfamily endonuclease